jgi:hypothetical protein
MHVCSFWSYYFVKVIFVDTIFTIISIMIHDIHHFGYENVCCTKNYLWNSTKNNNNMKNQKL